jgi:hypothetical protein
MQRFRTSRSGVSDRSARWWHGSSVAASQRSGRLPSYMPSMSTVAAGAVPSMVPTSIAGAVGWAALASVLAGACWVAGKVHSTRRYWQECKADTLATPGLRCATWVKSGFAEWFRVNDVIMGGRSSSSLDTDADGRLVFEGVISTNGGGFASMRTTERCHVSIPSGARAIRIVAEGDGQLWKVNLGLSHSLMDSQPTWTHDFLTSKGVRTCLSLHAARLPTALRGGGSVWNWLAVALIPCPPSSSLLWSRSCVMLQVKQTYMLPLAAMSAQTRGRKVPGVMLDLGQVEYVGLILSLVDQEGRPNSHFGDGPFRLVVHELEFE